MIYTSSSKMDLFDWCPRKYRLREIEKIPSPVKIPAFALGTVCHKQIDVFWKNFSLDIDDYYADIDAYYAMIIKTNEILKLSNDLYIKFKEYFNNFLNFQIRRINNYIKLYGENDALIYKMFYPIASEKRGSIQVSNTIKFGYVIDALFWNPNGNILIDWKTDKVCTRAQYETHVPQLNRYTIAMTYDKLHCAKNGVFFLKCGTFFSGINNPSYDFDADILGFVRKLQTSKFEKVPENESFKCCTDKYSCEYYPDICTGNNKK